MKVRAAVSERLVRQQGREHIDRLPRRVIQGLVLAAESQEFLSINMQQLARVNVDQLDQLLP